MKFLFVILSAVFLASCATYEETRPDGTVIKKTEPVPGSIQALSDGLKIIAEK